MTTVKVRVPFFAINSIVICFCVTILASDGGWSAWGVVIPCSVTCAGGMETVRRNCTFPPPNGGMDCLTENSSRASSEEKMQSCNTFACPGINNFQHL